jgi:MFS family permease
MSATTAAPDRSVHLDLAAAHRRRHHSFGFWAAAVALAADMAFSAVPTPLYVLYQRRDHFSTLTITIVFAVYAVGVVGSLFVAGHVSDWVGRKRMFVPALLINVLSALVFLIAPSLAGLLVARVISGISVGLITATATAYLGELHVGVFGEGAASGRRPQIVATAANLGGIGLGPLAAGLLAQFAPAPLRLPYIIFGAVLVGLAVLVAASPETVQRPEISVAWRPQQIAVPAHARAVFFTATAAGSCAFAVLGVFTSLAPSFLATTVHETSHAVAGEVAFAAFAAAAIAQIGLSRAGTRTTLKTGIVSLLPGLALLTGGMWAPSLTLFVVGAIITGAGTGLAFRGALTAAASTAPAQSRAEVLAGYFLGSYLGLSLPAVALGIAAQHTPARNVMLVFAAVIAVAVVAAGSAVLAKTSSRAEIPTP